MHKKTGVIFTRDVKIRMRDGVDLMANVFRPAVERPCPVVMSVTPYGKDVLPDWLLCLSETPNGLPSCL